MPGPVLVAFWGLETDFGKVMGNMQTLRSLATLAFDCRRPDEFKEQLTRCPARHRARRPHPDEMRGPWAGEVGQFQFVPSVYYKYAVDFDGDGRRNLITARRRARLGRQLSRRSRLEARPALARGSARARESALGSGGRHHQEAARFLGAARRHLANGKPIPPTTCRSGLQLPMGRNGPAFLTYPNFDVYLEWNKSLVYSTTAAYYATRLAGAPALSPGERRSIPWHARGQGAPAVSRQARLRRGQDRRRDRRLDPR